MSATTPRPARLRAGTVTADHMPAVPRSGRPESRSVEQGVSIPPGAGGTTTTTPLAGGGFIDDIAVQRCVAGTLDHGTGMSRAERELAVLQLYRRGYTNPEIVRRTGVSIRTIGSILRRAAGTPVGVARYVPAVPDGCTPDIARQARLVVAVRAPDAVVVREVLDALGLIAVNTSLRPADAMTGEHDAAPPTIEGNS